MTEEKETKKNLEERTKLYERAKYAAPGIIAAGLGAFEPEIKKKLEGYEQVKQEKIKTYAKIGAGVLAGGLLAYLFAKK